MKVLWFAIGFVCCLLLAFGSFCFWDNHVYYERTRGGSYASVHMDDFPREESVKRAMNEMGSEEFQRRMRGVIRDELRRYIKELSWEVVEELDVSYEGDASGFHFTYSYKVALSSREERGLDGLRGALQLAVVKARGEHLDKAMRGE